MKSTLFFSELILKIESFITTDNVLLYTRAFYHKSLQKCRVFCTEIFLKKFRENSLLVIILITC